MKKYKFNYKPYVYPLLTLALLFSVAGLVWNIFNVTQYFNKDAFKTVSYFIVGFIALLLALFITSVMVCSKYYIKKGFLYCSFGFFTVKTDLEKITEVVKFVKCDKLVIYYDEDKYSVIVISPSEYEDFIAELLKNNKNVSYSIDVKEN